MTDLEQRVNDAKSFLDYAHGNDGCGDDHATRSEEVKRSTTKMLIFIQALIECYHQQQAEINRLKSEKLKLKPMSEAPRREKTPILVYHNHYNVPEWEIISWYDCLYNGEYWGFGDERCMMEEECIIGWIDLSDLPAEIEAEDGTTSGNGD